MPTSLPHLATRIVPAGREFGIKTLDHDAIKWNRIMISSLCLSMISAQTRFAFVARENQFPLFRITL
jgi:hypothetical protein